MSSLLSADLAAACSALGYFDQKSNKYYADSNTLETVKDLIRYLRRDDEEYEIRRQLGEAKVLQTDLLPLLKSYWEETDLFDVLLRLIVNLTTPALVLWKEELPKFKIARNHYMQIEDHLQNYKEAFADEAVWAVLSTRLSKILEIDHVERGDENGLIIERILVLIRNILYVPADNMERRTDNDASVHDQVLWALHQSGMLDIILYMSSSVTEQAYYMHILEILSFMLREQKASDLANAALQRSQTEKIRDEAELLAMRHRETNEKQKKMKVYMGSRHSRFGGTYVVKSMKSIGENELIYHKPLNKVDGLNFDADKKKPRTPKNRLPISYSTMERRSAFSIRLFLKEFCVEFLNGAYNTLMHQARQNLDRARAQTHDESYYLWALRFFMEFNRCYKFEVKLVSETMSVRTFHKVQQQSENYFDLMQTDKKKLRYWSRRLHLALLAYRELFFTLAAMDKSLDGTVKESARVIKSNIFYVLEYREFILTLLVMYDELKMSNMYLKDLMETQHIFVKMLECFCARERGVVVQTKGRKKKNKQQQKRGAALVPQPMDLNLEGRWDEAAPQLSTVLGGGSEFTSDVVPFDAASDVPIDDQKTEAMINIQRKLRSGEFYEAISLLRAAREVWPENDSFGSYNMPVEEEFVALREIFFADLGENKPEPAKSQSGNEQDVDHDDGSDEEDDGQELFNEANFKFEDFTKRLANPKIVRACGLALKEFDKNSVNTNHCIVKLLHRIAFDCKMYVMVFQLSIFRTFQRVFAMKDFPEHKELVKFATFIMRKFFVVAEMNEKVYIETLFWKSCSEAYEIENGYGTSKSTALTKGWSDEEEDELRRLFVEHQQSQSEEDVVDWICKNLVNDTRTRRGVLKKLKEMHLIIDYKSKSTGVRTKGPRPWTQEEEEQLTELWQEFRDATDPLDCIMSRLELSRPKNRIVEKMLVMGLILDKKEVRKKRVKSSHKLKSNGEDNDDNSVDSNSTDEEGVAPESQSKPPKKTAGAAAPRKKAGEGTKKARNKQKSGHVPVPRAQLAKHFINLMESGMAEPLEWLKGSLGDAIEDFEEENNEGIPLVPIMDYAETAMENKEFQQMLKAIGFCEPFDEQESYWRIPSHLTVEVLNSYVTIIEQALDGSLTVPESEPQESVAEQPEQNEESSDEDVFDKLRKITSSEPQHSNTSSSKKPEPSLLEIQEKQEDLNDQIIEVPKVKNRNKRSRIRIESDDDDESNDLMRLTEVGEGTTLDNKENETHILNRSLRTILDSDSDEDDAGAVESKRLRSVSDSDSEKPVAKRGKIIDSDDE